MEIMNEKVYVLEFDDGVKNIYHNKEKAEKEMLRSWFESYAEENLKKAINQMKKIREGTNEAYDAGEVQRTIETVCNDLHDFLTYGYIECYAWLSEAEVAD